MSIDLSSSISSTTSKASKDYENSAIVLLLKKMASGTSRVLGGMIGLPWDGDDMSLPDIGIVEDMFAMDRNEDYGMVDALLPYVSPMLKVLLPNDSVDDVRKVKNQVKSVSFQSTPSTAPLNTKSTPVEEGLVLPAPDVMERLDFVITQMDIARMERAASRRLDVKSIHDLPTITYGIGNDLICPSYDSGNDDRDEREWIGQGHEHTQDNTQVWSWMVVPRESSKEMTRICNDTPMSSSNGSGSDCMKSSFDHCVICKEHFQEGEVLRVLPCQHLFHSPCICSENILEQTLSGCAMCKKIETPSDVSSTGASHRSFLNDQPIESSCQSDGSVPSWAFVKLGSLLSSKGKD
ncbi:hypothetical protein ACHAXN_008767 [Cyclotella atomus]